jgi:CDP-diacylglycerol--glycerol-3-phosphate 3-phosphatidyltransferase
MKSEPVIALPYFMAMFAGDKNIENVDGKKLIVKDTVFTWSNLISLSRILVVFPIIYLHQKNNLQITTPIMILIVYGVVSDYLDGLIARLTNSISELGKMMDPIADKTAAGLLFIYTVWLEWVPLWFLVFFVVRDLLIIAGSTLIRQKYGKVAMAIMSGKITVNVQALYWISVFFFPDYAEVQFWLLWASVAMMTYSFLDYFNRFRIIMKGAEFN